MSAQELDELKKEIAFAKSQRDHYKFATKEWELRNTELAALNIRAASVEAKVGVDPLRWESWWNRRMDYAENAITFGMSFAFLTLTKLNLDFRARVAGALVVVWIAPHRGNRLVRDW